MIKINIEHDDVGVAAAVGSIIDKALAEHGFTNVKAKMVMVLQKPIPEPHFQKVSLVTPLGIPGVELRPAGYETELMSAKNAFGYPYVFEWMQETYPDLFAAPVLIDTGIEPGDYAKQLKAFKEGTDREAV